MVFAVHCVRRPAASTSGKRGSVGRSQRAARESDGDLVLVNLSDPVRIILELTALEQVFTTETGASAPVGVVADSSGRPVETR